MKLHGISVGLSLKIEVDTKTKKCMECSKEYLNPGV